VKYLKLKKSLKLIRGLFPLKKNFNLFYPLKFISGGNPAGGTDTQVQGVLVLCLIDRMRPSK
jgi:hypothetical protein